MEPAKSCCPLQLGAIIYKGLGGFTASAQGEFQFRGGEDPPIALSFENTMNIHWSFHSESGLWGEMMACLFWRRQSGILPEDQNTQN